MPFVSLSTDLLPPAPAGGFSCYNFLMSASKTCILCNNPITHSTANSVKYCITCAVLKQREHQKNWLRSLSPVAKAAYLKRKRDSYARRPRKPRKQYIVFKACKICAVFIRQNKPPSGPILYCADCRKLVAWFHGKLWATKLDRRGYYKKYYRSISPEQYAKKKERARIGMAKHKKRRREGLPYMSLPV